MQQQTANTETQQTQATETQNSESQKLQEKSNVIWATGRRKTSVARIKMVVNGTGKIIVNSKSLDTYFGGHERYKHAVLQPLKLIGELKKYDFFVTASGGGIMGQSEAIRLGIARALSKLNENYRPKLKESGFLRRDHRIVERKKACQPKARKKFQWTKR